MKRKRFQGDPTEVLRGADPLDPLEVPQDTSGAHARALFQEVTSMETMERERTSTVSAPRRRRLAVAAAGFAIVAVAVAGIAIFSGGDSPEDVVVAPPTPTEPSIVDDPIVGGVPIAAAAMCAEFYDLTTLADRDIAFDGAVASANGDAVTFTVNEWFTGGDGETVTLQAMGIAPGTITSAGPALEIGERYLVSGSGGNVWSCGFTMTYDTAIAGEWATVFGG